MQGQQVFVFACVQLLSSKNHMLLAFASVVGIPIVHALYPFRFIYGHWPIHQHVIFEFETATDKSNWFPSIAIIKQNPHRITLLRVSRLFLFVSTQHSLKSVNKSHTHTQFTLLQHESRTSPPNCHKMISACVTIVGAMEAAENSVANRHRK